MSENKKNNKYEKIKEITNQLEEGFLQKCKERCQSN